jgi:hypothetical protein
MRKHLTNSVFFPRLAAETTNIIILLLQWSLWKGGDYPFLFSLALFL